jgi:hypothetical protein
MTSSVSGCCYRESRLTVSSRERIVTGILFFTRKHFKKRKTFCYLSPDSFDYQKLRLSSLSLSCTHTMVPDRLYNNNNNNYGVPRLSVFSLICATGTQFLRVSLTSQKENGKNAFAFRVRRPGETRVGSACGPLVCVWNFGWERSLWLERKRSPGAPPSPSWMIKRSLTHRQGARRNLCKTHTLGEGFASPLLSLNNR